MKLEDVDRAQLLAAQLRHIKLGLERVSTRRDSFHDVKIGNDSIALGFPALAYLRVQGNDLLEVLKILEARTLAATGQTGSRGVVSRPVVYYAHCMALYDTPQEKRDVLLLVRLGWDVVNPNGAAHQAGAKKQGMDYFKPLAQDCELLAFRALPDGAIPAGVALEIEWAHAVAMPVIEIPGSVLRRGITREQTREYIREVGKW